MWSIIASLLAIAVFASVALMVNDRTAQAIQDATLRKASEQSAALLSQFSRSAHQDALSLSKPAGTVILVSDLINDGVLPAGFPTANPLGQTMRAVVGTTSPNSAAVAAWYDSAPTKLFGRPINASTVTLLSLEIAQSAAAMQQNTGALFGVADTSPPGSGAPYTAIRMPFAATAQNATTAVPAFSSSVHSAVALYFN